MTIPAWPERLPPPTLANYSYQAQAPLIRTNMDTGLARQRRRFVSIPSQIGVQFVLNQEQLALFEAFCHYDLLDGLCWFTARIANGMEVQGVKARWIGAWKVDLLDAGIWQVSGTLESINLPVVTPEQYIALRDFGEDVIHWASSDLHKLIHVELPGPLIW